MEIEDVILQRSKCPTCPTAPTMEDILSRLAFLLGELAESFYESAPLLLDCVSVS